MPQATALSNFARLNEAALHRRAITVVSALTNNPNFTDIGALLTNLSAASTAFSDAMVLSKVGTPSEVAEKKLRKEELLASLKAVCNYVNFIAAGNRPILLTTGFEISKETRTNVVVEAVKEMIIKYGTLSGTLEISVKKGPGVRTVSFQYCVADVIDSNSHWVSVGYTESTCTLTNLPVGKMVWLRAGVIGPRRQTIYNEPVQKMIA